MVMDVNYAFFSMNLHMELMRYLKLLIVRVPEKKGTTTVIKSYVF